MEKIPLERHFEFPHLREVLEKIGKVAEETYKSYLEEGQKNTTKQTLFNSVKFEVVADGNQYEVGLHLADYWKYVESGRKPGGKFPPPDVIREWIKVKPILPSARNGKLPSLNQLTYLIGRKIARDGIKPFPALRLTTEEIEEVYQDQIVDAFMQDVGEDVEMTLRMFVSQE